MFKPFLFSLTALSISFAQTATAEDYEIIIEEGAFYPGITYLVPGDSVTFVNNHDNAVEVKASDASWTTGQLSTNEEYALPIAEETKLTFALAADPEIAGSFSFELAPLGSADNEEDIGDGAGPESSN